MLPLAQIEAAAGITGNLATGLAVFGAALAVGLIGFRTVEAVGRNPQAQGKILPLALVLGAFAEGLGILAIFVLGGK
jgi:F-type H+-transporting ATPase subunit c